MPDFKIQFKVFEGPMDLLLFLVKKQEVDIYEVNMTRLAAQFIEYVELMKQLDLEQAGEFIVMASTLMYIKSKELLPVDLQVLSEEDEEEDPRWDLIRQLVEYKKFKDAAGTLAEKARRQEDLFAHTPEKPEVVDSESAPLAEISIFDLIRAFQGVLKRFEEAHDFGDIIDDRFTVSDKMDLLLTTLSPGQSMSFRSLFASASTKTEVIVTFLAVLELMKLNQFVIWQDQILGDIEIERRSGS